MPTFCGWCLTDEPHTHALSCCPSHRTHDPTIRSEPPLPAPKVPRLATHYLNWSLRLLWMLLQKSSTVFLPRLSTTGAS